MPFYYGIDARHESGQRTAAGLLRLKNAFRRHQLPERTVERSLLLATWNIRELGGNKQGPRSDESLYYLAEVISAFDLVAVQEVRSNLEPLNKLTKLLGSWWKYLLTDVTLGHRGNDERMAFLYDSRKIRFGGFTSQVVIPPVRLKNKLLKPANQIARTPFMVGFQAGWFKFTLCTTHILYGSDKAENPERVAEIRALAQYLRARVDDPHAWSRNLILLGDFNIFSPTDATMKALTDSGFTVPEGLQRLPSNAPKNKHYDQIAFIAPSVEDQFTLCKSGVLDVFASVYREGDEKDYVKAMGARYQGKPAKQRSTYFRTWRTFQLSDHLPMWIELKTDFSAGYLAQKMRGKVARPAKLETTL
jgi:endonuclease/exonuclease/phosphatase family metal-dependent hydrolase